jgi:anti-anti-sigma regulatory factor
VGRTPPLRNVVTPHTPDKPRGRPTATQIDAPGDLHFRKLAERVRRRTVRLINALNHLIPFTQAGCGVPKMVALQTSSETTIVADCASFSHQDADAVSRLAIAKGNAKRVVIDMAMAHIATTSAFARLVLLRRSLLKTGRDLRLVHLHDQVASLYEMFRLAEVLPSA